MSNEEFINSLAEEVRQKLADCKTPDEIRKVLAEAGIEPLDDDALDAISGGKTLPHSLNQDRKQFF